MVEPREDRPTPPRWQRLLDDLRRRDESSEFDEDLAEDLTFDRFIVLERVGAGGMGEVFEAIDLRLDRTVALKFCKLPAESAAEMIEHEARCLARLAHPNVVTVHDVVREGSDLVLVMEYVRGSTLRTWQDATRPAWQVVLDRYIEAARGLDAAHQQELVHGDVKPGNVLVGDDGRVRVIDFGVARHSYEALDSLADPLGLKWKGTPCYMAPEQLREQAAGVAADVYGFCVSVWESLYGARPFAGETAAALLAAIERGEPGKGSVVVPDVPAAIEVVLRRGLSERASERPASIAALVEALVQASEHEAGQRARRRAWLRRGLFAAVWLLVWLAVLLALRGEPRVVEVEVEPDPLAQTLALAVDAMDQGLPDSAIQYLELARRRALVAGDEVALREVARQAEALGDDFARRGDKGRARECWYVAGEIFAGLPEPAAAFERLQLKTTRSR